MMTKPEREIAANVLKALAHPIRLGVMEVLVEGEKTITELYEVLDCSQSMMSQQLKILSQQKLVQIRKKGTQKYCSLNNPDFLELLDCMQQHMRLFLNL